MPAVSGRTIHTASGQTIRRKKKGGGTTRVVTPKQTHHAVSHAVTVSPKGSVSGGPKPQRQKVKHQLRAAHKQARVARQYQRAIAKNRVYHASKISPEQQRYNLVHPGVTGKQIEDARLEAMAPTGIRIVNALTGADPAHSTLQNIGSVLGTLAVGGGDAALLKRLPEAAKVVSEVSKGRSAEAARAAEEAGVASKGGKVARTVTKARKPVKSLKVRYAKPARAARRSSRLEKTLTKSGRPLYNIPAADTARHGPSEKTVSALVEGHVRAIEHHPLETLKTTARALPAAVAFPAAAAYETAKTGYRAAQTAIPGGKSYSGKEIVAPVKSLADETKQFATQVGGKLLSGDPKKVEKAVRKDVGLSFLVPIPKVLGGEKGTAVRTAAREKVAAKIERVSPVKPRTVRRRVTISSRAEHRAAEHEVAHHARQLAKPLRKVKGGRSLKHLHGIAPEDTVHLLASYGISHDPKVALHQIENIRSKVNRKAPEPGALRLSQVVDHIAENPKLLEDKNLWRAVDAYKVGARKIETSPRKKYLRLGDLHNVPRPEERVPHAARNFTPARTREEAFKDVQNRERSIKQLRDQARREQNTGVKKTLYARARQVQADTRKLKQALHPYTRPGQSIDKTVREPWDKALVNEYVNEVKAKAQGHEEPAFVSDVAIGHMGAGEVSQRFASGAKAPHVAEVNELAADHLDNSIRSLITGSIERPRLTRAWARFLQNFSENEAIKLNGREIVTRRDYEAAVHDGRVNPRHYVFLPSREYKQALENDFAHEHFKSPEAIVGDLENRIPPRIRSMRAQHGAMNDVPGTKGIVVHREAAAELQSLLDKPGLLERGLNKFALGSNRILLGLSPGWAASQIVAEALPILMAANPKDVVKGMASLRTLNKTTPEEGRAFASLAGEAPRVTDQPMTLRPELRPETNREVSDMFRALDRNPGTRALWSGVRARPLAVFDRMRSGKYRQVLAAAEVNRDLNSFVRGLRGSLRFSRETAEKLKGKPLHEQMAYLAAHPKEATKLQGYIDDIAGNWDAFTRFEREFAPALIFYSFLRYSLRWTFWSFPKAHPVRAQIAYFLGQMNADQLEKLLGAKPANPLDYAMPVVNDGGAVLPGGIRIAPGLNALTEAIGANNPAGLTRALNPVLGTAITGLTGVSALSGRQEATSTYEKGILALNQLLSMPAPVRALGIRAGQTSDISREFKRIDPKQTLRSVLDPAIPLSAERYRLKNELSKILDRIGNKPELGDFIDAYYQGDNAKVEQLRKQLRLSRAASDKLKAFLPETPARTKAVKRAYGSYYPSQPTKKSSSSGFSTGGFSGGGLKSGGF